MPSVGGPELVIVLVVFVVLFGARRLPELGAAVGKTIRGLREGFDDDGES